VHERGDRRDDRADRRDVVEGEGDQADHIGVSALQVLSVADDEVLENRLDGIDLAHASTAEHHGLVHAPGAIDDELDRDALRGGADFAADILRPRDGDDQEQEREDASDHRQGTTAHAPGRRPWWRP